jgi:uncharacterized protein
LIAQLCSGDALPPPEVRATITAALARTPDDRLWVAAQAGSVAGMAAALADGASVDAFAGTCSWPPLLVCAMDGDADCVDLLLRAGANVHATDHQGNTALMAAATQEHTAVVGRLLRAGARVDAVDASGHTAVHDAVNRGSLGTVRWLITQGGADTLAGNGADRSALCLVSVATVVNARRVAAAARQR